MTHRIDSTSLNNVFQSLAEHGFDGMAAAMQVLLNECMKIERQAGPAPRALRAQRPASGPGERL